MAQQDEGVPVALENVAPASDPPQNNSDLMIGPAVAVWFAVFLWLAAMIVAAAAVEIVAHESRAHGSFFLFMINWSVVLSLAHLAWETCARRQVPDKTAYIIVFGLLEGAWLVALMVNGSSLHVPGLVLQCVAFSVEFIITTLLLPLQAPRT